MISYQNDDLNVIEKLLEEINNLKKRNEQLLEGRNHYMYIYAWTDLYNDYVGRYNPDDKSLIVNHFINRNIMHPYGDADFIDDIKATKIMGSWDNWTKEYKLHKKSVNSSGTYEGYVDYIILTDTLQEGDEYEFKFKDKHGDWIEPIDEEFETITDEETPTGAINKLKRNTTGSWNAIIKIRKV